MTFGPVNERLLRVGVVVLVASTLTFALIGLSTGDTDWFSMAIAGGLASAGPLSQILTRRYELMFPVFWTALVIAVAQGVVGLPDTIVASGIALVALGGGASILAGRQRWVVAGTWAAMLVGLGFWWQPDNPWPLGLGLAGGFVFLVWTLIEADVVYQHNQAVRSRNDDLFDRSDVAILQFDFSEVMPELAKLAAASNDLEADLLDDHEQLDRLFGGIWIANANQAARRALGMEGQELPVRQPPRVQPVNREAASAWLAALADGAREWSGAVWFPRTEDTGRWYQLRHLVAMDDEDYSMTIVTAMDITAVMEAQATLHELDAAKNEFIATITHEMRTPLAGVVGFSSELDDHFDSHEPAVVREMVGLIRRQSSEIAHILDDLMTVAAAEMTALKVDKEIFDVRALVSEVAGNARLAIEAAGDAAIEAVGDPMRVRQILRNLLSNTDRYGGPNRRIDIASDADFVSIAVIDDGPGLSDDRIKEIFSTYGVVDSSEVRGSMGLGLYVSRTLAHLMGAGLEYHRRNNETHFVLRLLTPERADPPTYAP